MSHVLHILAPSHLRFKAEYIVRVNDALIMLIILEKCKDLYLNNRNYSKTISLMDEQCFAYIRHLNYCRSEYQSEWCVNYVDSFREI